MLQGAKSGDLLYASFVNGPTIYVYSYPRGELVGKLTPFASGYYPQGLCTDSSGDVFVTAPLANSTSQSNIYEYAHGRTSPLATLSDPGWALGCAVDPTTGNLAVTNLYPTGYGKGDVAIYTDAKGTPTAYGDSNIEAFDFCTYDNQGNLFATGFSEYYAFNLFELPEGMSTFTDISLNKSFTVASIQWTSGSLAAAAFDGSPRGEQSIYQIQIAGTSGTVSGPTLLRSRRDRKNREAVQFWVQGSTIMGPYYLGGIGLWRYPKGGRPKEVIGSPGFYGVTVSVSRRG